MFVCFATTPGFTVSSAHRDDALVLLFADGHLALVPHGDINPAEAPPGEGAGGNYNLQWTKCGLEGYDVKN